MAALTRLLTLSLLSNITVKKSEPVSDFFANNYKDYP